MITAVLLATYNGEKFLKPQIESLLNQTYNNFTIYISDDFSTDSTNEIIKEYIEKFPSKIIKLHNTKRFGNARDNFFSLVSRVEADCYLFCDQDDVWNPDKIEILITEYQKHQEDIPTVIHSDLSVVDKELNPINSSLFEIMHLDKNPSWKNLLVQNNATGCAMLINKALADLYKNNNQIINTDNIIMHDYFFVLSASLFGNVYYIDKSLLQYRQHENNSVGAKNTKSFSYILFKLRELKNGRNLVRKTEIQTGEILKIFTDEMKSSNLYKIINNYHQLQKYPKLYRIYFIIKNHLQKNTFSRIVYQLLLS